MELLSLVGTAAGMVGALAQFSHTVSVQYIDPNGEEQVAIHTFSHVSSHQIRTFITDNVPAQCNYSLLIGYSTNESRPVEKYQLKKCNQLLVELVLQEDGRRVNPIILVQAPRTELVEATLKDYHLYTKRQAGRKDPSWRYFQGTGFLITHTFKSSDNEVVDFKDVMIYKPHPLFDPQEWMARLLMKVKLR